MGRNGEKAWLGKWLNSAIRDKKLDILSVEHVRRMLTKVQKYDLSYAQMEYEAEPGSSKFVESDWLIGVRSEAEMTRLMEHGFTYIDDDEPDAPKNPGAVDEFNREYGDGPLKLTIPVSREREGALISITRLRVPNFASKQDVHSAFEPYGVVTKVEREHWDLPEDEANSELVSQLESTNTMTWHVTLYKNELSFDVIPLHEFAEAPRKQLEWRKLLECPAVEIYGQKCPILPNGIVSHNNASVARDIDDTGMTPVLHRFSLSELFVFAKQFADTTKDMENALSTALDSAMPKEAVIQHLIQPLSILNMVMNDKLPGEPDNASEKESIMNPHSTRRQQFTNMSYSELQERVTHYKAEGFVSEAEFREMDNALNPKERCIDLLLQVQLKQPRMHDRSNHNGGVVWKSRWEELATCLSNLKMSLYITTARLREMTVPQLKDRALKDSGVRPIMLNAAIAWEMWLRCEEDGCDRLVRQEFKMLPAATPLGYHPLGEATKSMSTYFFPTEHSDAHKRRVNRTKSTSALCKTVHTRIFKTSFSPEDIDVHTKLIGIVSRRKDILQEAEVTPAKREGAIKAILLKFDLGGSSTAALDKELEILSRPQLHSKTIEGFKISDLYRLGEDKHLERKWENFWDPALFGTDEEHAKQQEEKEYTSVQMEAALSAIDRSGRKPLHGKARVKNQLAAALDSDDPRKDLIWRLLESTSRPAPLTQDEQDEEEEKRRKHSNLKDLIGLTTRQSVDRSPSPGAGSGGDDSAAAMAVEQALVPTRVAAFPPVPLGSKLRQQEPDDGSVQIGSRYFTGPDLASTLPSEMPAWAVRMGENMSKVIDRADKLCHHTEKLDEKVGRMQFDLVRGLAELTATGTERDDPQQEDAY